MMRLGYCSNCGSVLSIPLGAQVIRCGICQAMTGIFDPPEASPYNHAPPGPPPSAHGPKKAVICGISYRYSRHELKGCDTDAKLMRKLCIEKFNFPKSSIIMLTEEETDPFRIPTKQNMRRALNWLVQGCQSGDSLLFYYAGHGSQIRNNNGDEYDGLDEALSPVDFETEGKIVDDEINRTIVNPLPPGVKLHAIIDTCSSGTVLDLQFICKVDNKNGTHKWDEHRSRSGLYMGTNGGEAILFSGCDDHQYSHELHKNTTKPPSLGHGVMTVCFIQAISELGVGATYGSILTSTRNAIPPITNANAVKSLLKGGSLADRVYNTLIKDRHRNLGDAIKSVLIMLQKHYSKQDEKYIQEPQLTSNHPFDIQAKQFFL